ncbi:hypothetical protein ACFE04_022739 [Oxalis oulophora]
MLFLKFLLLCVNRSLHRIPSSSPPPPFNLPNSFKPSIKHSFLLMKNNAIYTAAPDVELKPPPPSIPPPSIPPTTSPSPFKQILTVISISIVFKIVVGGDKDILPLFCTLVQMLYNGGRENLGKENGHSKIVEFHQITRSKGKLRQIYYTCNENHPKKLSAPLPSDSKAPPLSLKTKLLLASIVGFVLLGYLLKPVWFAVFLSTVTKRIVKRKIARNSLIAALSLSWIIYDQFGIVMLLSSLIGYAISSLQ